MLEATPEEETQKRAKLNFQVQTISAYIQGLKDKYPEKYDKETLITNALISHSALKDAERQASEAAASESDPAIRQEKLRAYDNAKLQHANSLDALTQRAELEKIFSPDAKKDSWSEYVSSINQAESYVIRAEQELAKATNPAEKAAAAEKLERVKLVRTQLYAAKERQAAIQAQAEIDAQGGIFAIGSDGNVQKFTPQEIEAGGLQRLGADFDDKVQKATGQDSSKIQAANSARETALSVGSLSGELADIISQDSRVLTQTANFVGFLGKLKAEFEAANSVTEQRVISLAQEENLLPFNAKAGELDRLSDLNSRFNAKLIQLGFTAGASEGTSGNAMSNQDYNNLVRLISAGNTRNPATFLTNLNDYTQRRIAQADSMVNTTRSPGSSLFNTVDIAVTSDQARDALLKRLSPPDVATYVKDNPTEFRVQNYQKLQQALDNARKRQEGGTNLRQIMLLLRGSGLKGIETTEGLIQKSQVIDSQLKELVNTINNNPAAKNKAIDTFKNYVGQTSGLQAPDLEVLVNLYINQPQQR
jgi:hypothetical protein